MNTVWRRSTYELERRAEIAYPFNPDHGHPGDDTLLLPGSYFAGRGQCGQACCHAYNHPDDYCPGGKTHQYASPFKNGFCLPHCHARPHRNDHLDAQPNLYSFCSTHAHAHAYSFRYAYPYPNPYGQPHPAATCRYAYTYPNYRSLRVVFLIFKEQSIDD